MTFHDAQQCHGPSSEIFENISLVLVFHTEMVLYIRQFQTFIKKKNRDFLM